MISIERCQNKWGFKWSKWKFLWNIPTGTDVKHALAANIYDMLPVVFRPRRLLVRFFFKSELLDAEAERFLNFAISWSSVGALRTRIKIAIYAFLDKPLCRQLARWWDSTFQFFPARSRHSLWLREVILILLKFYLDTYFIKLELPLFYSFWMQTGIYCFAFYRFVHQVILEKLRK